MQHGIMAAQLSSALPQMTLLLPLILLQIPHLPHRIHQFKLLLDVGVTDFILGSIDFELDLSNQHCSNFTAVVELTIVTYFGDFNSVLVVNLDLNIGFNSTSAPLKCVFLYS